VVKNQAHGPLGSLMPTSLLLRIMVPKEELPITTDTIGLVGG